MSVLTRHITRLKNRMLFSNAIEESINKPNMLTEVKKLYITENLNRQCSLTNKIYLKMKDNVTSFLYI
jgi:hypothetical protein